jgi:hypothetical protein
MTQRNRHSSLQIFYDEIYEPEKTTEPLLETYFKIIDSVDKDKLFEPVLLREFSDLGLEMIDRSPSKNVKNETKDFVHFLHAIATKESGVDVPTTFARDKISIGIFLIGRPETYLTYGIEPYIHKIREKHKEGINTLYLCAKGPQLISAAKSIAIHLEKTGMFKKVGEFQQKTAFYERKNKAIIRIAMKSS